MKGNKGDMSSQTIIGIVVALVGFLILLYLFYQFAWTGTIDKEVCHESIVLRGTMPSIAKSFAPLKCKTEKICITSKYFGGKCTEYQNAKGITTIKVRDVKEVERAIADSILDCWSMTGEGKLSLFNQKLAETYGAGFIYPTCVICSRIAFDKNSLTKSKIDLRDMDVVNYTKTHLIPGREETYYDYMAGENAGKFSVGDKLELPVLTVSKDNKTNEETLYASSEKESDVVPFLKGEELEKYLKEQKNDDDLQTKELAILFMQITSPKHGESALNIVKTVGAAGLGVGVVSSSAFGFGTTAKVAARGVSSVTKACAASGPAAIVCAAIPIILGVVQQGMVAYNRDISATKCGDVSTGSEARDGCSVVRTVNYDENSIKDYCGVIESIP